MNGTLPHALLDTLDYLMTLSWEGTRPEAARARLRLLQQRHPDTPMELLWEEEAYDQSVHYDVLLRLSGEGTVSLSFCPDRVLPWPMRGFHRAKEMDLVRVNNTVLTVEQAMGCLDFIWDEAHIINRLVNVCLIQEALDKDPIELSDEEMQLAMDGFRRAHTLYRIEDTHRWMKRRGMTHEQLERYVSDEATIAKLRDRVTAGRVEDYFEAHRADFDTVCIARFECSDEDSAHRTCEQIRSGKMDFYEAAQRRFLGAAGSEPLSGDVFAIVQHGRASPEVASAVFAAAPGELVGPIRTEAGYSIVRVLSFAPARLDEATGSAIKKILFEEWLAKRRQAAMIEWYWGNTGRTSQAV